MEIFNSKPIMSRLTRINSVDAIKSDATYPKSKFTVNLGKGLNNTKVIKVVLKSCSFTHTFYNVNLDNQTFTFLDNGVSRSVVLPIGWYDVSTYMPALKSLIDAILTSGNVVITQDVNNYKLNFAFAGTAGDNTLLPKASNPAANLVGITSNIVIASGANSDVQSTPRFYGLQEAFLHIGGKNLDTGNLANPNGQVYNLFTEVQLTAPFSAVQHFECQDERLCSIDFPAPIDIDELNVELVDRNNTTLDLQNHNLRCVLKMYYVNR